METEILRIRGKELSTECIAQIQHVIHDSGQRGRRVLSRLVCERLGWRQPNGQVQDMACREILLKLERLGKLAMPPVDRRGGGRARKVVGDVLELALEEAMPVLSGALGDYPAVELLAAETPEDRKRWNTQVSRYHYLGYQTLVGRVMKYRICLGAREVGLIGWASPSWKLASRDSYIGWDAATRERHLQGIANNHRFLIYPWVKIKNLASHVLSVAARRVVQDWWTRYGVRLYLLESFVDPSRFRGTCYKAANWVYLGQSRGSSKRGNGYVYHGQVKDVYVYPLAPDFREHLQGTLS
jgi:hypothetical protein